MIDTSKKQMSSSSIDVSITLCSNLEPKVDSTKKVDDYENAYFSISPSKNSVSTPLTNNFSSSSFGSSSLEDEQSLDYGEKEIIATFPPSETQLNSKRTSTRDVFERLYKSANNSDKESKKHPTVSTVARKLILSDIHDRLYARSQAKQLEGKEKRQNIAKMLTPKEKVSKKISVKQASSLFDRLYVEGVQKQVLLSKMDEETDVAAKEQIVYPTISTTKANTLYNRLYDDAVSKQLNEMRSFGKEKPKGKTITSKKADEVFNRLHKEKTVSMNLSKSAPVVEKKTKLNASKPEVFNRLYKEETLSMHFSRLAPVVVRNKTKVITSKQATEVYRRLYEGKTKITRKND